MTDQSSTSSSPCFQSLSTIVSYPSLLAYEEALVRSPHSVTHWYHYLTDIDSLLETLHEAETTYSSCGSGTKKFKPVTVGSKTYFSPTEIHTEIKGLYKSRIDVAERALALLPGSYKLWMNHLDFRLSLLPKNTISGNNDTISETKYKSIQSAFERSLVRMNTMPRIWLMYLSFVQTYHPTMDVTTIRRLYDRALISLPVTQHEKIWKGYLDWAKQLVPKEANTSEVTYQDVDEAADDPTAINSSTVQQSPATAQIPVETTLRILRRYAHSYNPLAREDLAKTCIALGRYGEGATLLVDILNDADFVSLQGSSKHDLWMLFTDICTKHPEEIQKVGSRIDFDKIVRAALGGAGSEKSKTYLTFFTPPEETSSLTGPEGAEEEKSTKSTTMMNFGEIEGTLWCKLADYYIRLGEFEAARSIYEEALESVTRVRDFSLVFDAYSRFEEGTITAHMTLMEEEEGEDTQQQEEEERDETQEEEGDEDAEDLKMLLDTKGDTTSSNDAIELEMARAEYLMERRPLLLNRVLLKQNPHNVGEWLRRAELYQALNKPNSRGEAVAALEEGCKSVKSQYAVNDNPTSLWTTLAKLHDDAGDVEKVRDVFRRVCVDRCYRFKVTDDLAQVWAAWVEFELKMENYDEALSVVRQAVATPSDYQHYGQQIAGKNGWYMLFSLSLFLSLFGCQVEAHSFATIHVTIVTI